MVRRALVLLLSLSFGGVGCDSPSGAPVATTSTGAPAPSASAAGSSAPTEAGSATTAPTSSASARSNAGASAGTWSGSYDAKRTTIALPSSVPWPSWKKDSGKQLGAGTIDLEVGSNGDVRGKVAGALGSMLLVGRVEDGKLRAGARPEDPEAEGAMTGVLVGDLGADAIRFTLRAASGEGETVRVAEGSLTRR